MVPVLRALSSGAVVVAMAACTATSEGEDDPHESNAHTDPQLAALDTSVARVDAHVSEGDPSAALRELYVAADLAAEFDRGGLVACRFGADVAEIADELLTDGAYGEARMAYAVAIYYVQGCETALPEELHAESLRNRKLDARAVHQWLAGA